MLEWSDDITVERLVRLNLMKLRTTDVRANVRAVRYTALPRSLAGECPSLKVDGGKELPPSNRQRSRERQGK